MRRATEATPDRVLFAPNNYRLFRSFLPLANALTDGGTELTVLDVAGTRSDTFPSQEELGCDARLHRLETRLPPYEGESWPRRRQRERAVHHALIAECEHLLASTRPAAVVVTAAETYYHHVLATMARRRGAAVIAMQPCVALPFSALLARRSPDMRLRKRLLRAANSAAIASGNLADRLRSRPVRPPGRRAWATGPVDAITVFGPFFREMFARDGAPVARMHIVGNPLYDLLSPERVERDAADARALLRLPTNVPIACFTTQPFHKVGITTPDVTERLTASIVEACLTSAPDAHVVLKLHPTEEESDYASFRSPRVSITRDASTYGVMAASDVVITAYSTTGLESVLLGTPIVTHNLLQRDEFDLYGEAGLATAHRDLEPFRIQLTELLGDAGRRRELLAQQRAASRHLVVADGRATERALGVLNRTVDSSPVAPLRRDGWGLPGDTGPL